MVRAARARLLAHRSKREEQALGPIQNPIEMDMPLDQLVEKLNKIEGYRKQFQSVFATAVTADALAKALAGGDLRPYARQHARIGALPDGMTRLLLWVERHPALRRRVIRALAREPSVFSRLLAVHCRALPARRGLEAAPRLLWRLVDGRQAST